MDNLNAKQIKFIDLYFKHNDVSTICKEMEIQRSTYYTYLNNKYVKKEINNRLKDMLENTTRYLQKQLYSCCDELMKIITNKETQPQIKINAINSVFNNCNKLTEQVDVINRLEDLEDRFNG